MVLSLMIEVRVVDSGYEFIFIMDGTSSFMHTIDGMSIIISLPINDSVKWQHIIATPESVPYDSTLYPEYQGKLIFKTILKTDRQFISKDVMRFKNTSSGTGVRDSKIDLTYKLTCCVEANVGDVYINNPSHVEDIIARNSHLQDNEYIIDKRVLTVQSMDVTLATRIDTLWRKGLAIYKDRYFKRHNTSLFATYEEDVYAKDPTTGLTFTTIDSDADGEDDRVVRTELIHAKGDTKLVNGQPVYVYKEGDVITGEDNLPIVDTINGVLRYIDMLMFDYKLIAIDKPEHLKYVQYARLNIVEWCNTYLQDTVNVTLEHTKLYYRPNKGNKSVMLKDGSVFDSVIRPTVKLYHNNNYDTQELTPMVYTSIVGRILQKEFSKQVISMENITEQVKAELGNGILAVKLTDFPTEAEIVSLDETSNRFTIGTVITPLGDIVHDISVELVKI